MAWDSSRPVPWDSLIRSWLIYVAIMAVVFALLYRDQSLIGVFAGLLVSGPLYLAFGYVLAKFGYKRKTWKELRAEREAKPATSGAASSKADTAESAGPRPKPAPTKRTGGANSRPTSSKKRRR